MSLNQAQKRGGGWRKLLYSSSIQMTPPPFHNQHIQHKWITGHGNCNTGCLSSRGCIITLVYLKNSYKLIWKFIKVVCTRGRVGGFACRCIHRCTLRAVSLLHGHVPTNIALWLALTQDGVTCGVMVSLLCQCLLLHCRFHKGLQCALQQVLQMINRHVMVQTNGKLGDLRSIIHNHNSLHL